MITRSRYRDWLHAFILVLPVVLFYAAHFGTRAPGRPTGFVQYDMPYYMANAREYIDGGTNGVFYALPFSADYGNAPIYFQPQIALLAGAWWITHMDPGHLFAMFGLLMALACARVCVAVLDMVIGAPSPFWLRLSFLWGGGALVVLGIGAGIAEGAPAWEVIAGSFRFDPKGGWWFMNLGRNLVLPLEAYYHLLFFGAIALLHVRKAMAALALAAILGFSHPFTGTACLLVLTSWALLERHYFHSNAVPRSFLIGAIAALIAVSMYYGVYLARDLEHRVLAEQWRLAWTEKAINFIPAYALVGGIAAWRLRTPALLLECFREPLRRLFAVWVLIWFALENHEFALEPHQPLHFTRGYTWSGLFLIGAPALLHGWTSLRARWGRWKTTIIIAPFFLLLLSDNLAWMASQTRGNWNGTSPAIILDADQEGAYQWLSAHAEGQPLLVASHHDLAYMAMVYTPLRSYCSHYFNTPWAEAQSFFAGVAKDPLLDGELLLLVNEAQGPTMPLSRAETVYRSGAYSVHRYPARE